MLVLYSIDEMPKVIRKTYELNPDVFLELRDFYEKNKDMRHHKAVIYRDQKPRFFFGYVRDRATKV